MGDVLKLMVYFAMAVTPALQQGLPRRPQHGPSRYFVLATFATLGMMVMISANHLLTVYIGLEMLSLSLYALVAFDRDSAPLHRSRDEVFRARRARLRPAALRHVDDLRRHRHLELSGIAQAIYHQAGNRTVLLFGLVFLMAGIAFKLGVVPFHMWVPDVYHGAPTAVTLLISTAPKLAAFAMAMRLLVNGIFELADQWQAMLMFLAIGSIVLGNIAAVAQSNIKRMLAYSGISHMGFMLLGLLSGVSMATRLALNALRLGHVLRGRLCADEPRLLRHGDPARARASKPRTWTTSRPQQAQPWFAAMMMFVMFSMAGVPFFIGFFAKLAVLRPPSPPVTCGWRCSP